MNLGIRAAEWIDRFGMRPQRLIGLALLRIGLGASMIYIYMCELPYRELLWGPHAAIPFAEFRRQAAGSGYSLYAVSSSELWFELVYFAGMLAALAWTIYGNRALTVVNAVFFWSLMSRDRWLGDGGDNLARILLILLVFTTANAYFSPAADKVRKKIAARTEKPAFVVALHNSFANLIVFQTCIVYTVAGLWKVSGSSWRDGTALTSISRVADFSYTSVFPWLMQYPVISLAAGYLAIAIQVCIGPAALTRNTWIREIEIMLIAGMHLGIMFGMGLFSFGMIMLAADLAIIRDGDYRKTLAVATRLRRRGAPEAAPVSREFVPTP